LVAAQKKQDSGKIATAFFIGMLSGVAFWAAMSQRYVFTALFALGAFLVGYFDNKKRKQLQAEISRREHEG
jgi:hypothetical protein